MLQQEFRVMRSIVGIFIGLALGACAEAPDPPPENAAVDQEPASVVIEAAVKPAEPRLAVRACEMQGEAALPHLRLRAVGTEPFWGARVEGRCVTYSHPEDQAGTRVWTRFEGRAEEGSWTGALGGKPFVLHTTPNPDCSDGMSDEVYPIAVRLTVGGEERQGCARPL